MSASKPKRPLRHTFSAAIVRHGTLYCVEVPERVSRAIGVKGNVPVLVRANSSAPFHGTLVPRGGGLHILRWIDDAAHEATRAKRLVRAVQEALARHERNIDRGLPK